MKSTSIINNMVNMYETSMLIRPNGTKLLDPGTWPEKPRARHMIFSNLKNEYIQEHLADSYKYKLPNQYIEFLQYANGVALFAIKLHTKKHQLAQNMLEIYGLPLAPSFDRIRGEEPHDVRIEDLRRMVGIPEHYLKCGHFAVKDSNNYLYRCGLYIDTSTGRVFGIPDETKEIEREWNDLDECLCDLIESMADCPYDLNCD